MGILSRYFNKYIDNKLADCPIEIHHDRCKMAKRNCGEVCIQSCPKQALTSSEMLEVDDTSCIGCGTCVTSCLNGAIAMKKYKDETFIRNTVNTCQGEKIVAISCEKSAANQEEALQHVKRLEVDCLARLHPGMIMLPLALGVEHVWVDISACSDCVHNIECKITNRIEQNFAQTVEWLSSLGADEQRLVIHEQMPLHLKREAVQNHIDKSAYDRRSFFVHLKQGVKSNTLGVFGDFADQVFEEKSEQPEAHGRVQGETKQREILQIAMQSIAKNHLVGDRTCSIQKLQIGDDCSLCNICSKLCPTGSIQQIKDEEQMYGNITFRAASCNQCYLCETLCPRNQISFGDQVLVADFISKKEEEVFYTKLNSCTKCKDNFPAKLETDELCPICARKKSNNIFS